MKSFAQKNYVLVCLILAFTAAMSLSASAQNIVESRYVLNFGFWNNDSYKIHGFMHVGSGVPNGHYYINCIGGSALTPFRPEFDIIDGESTMPEWFWSDFGYQARFVPDGGWRMLALSAVGPGGIFYPAGGEVTVWRQDYYFSGNVPPAIQRTFDFHISLGGFPSPSPTPAPHIKCGDDKSGGSQENCLGCNSLGMARYSIHSMLVSLNVQDTPIRYTPPRGPAIDFTVTYNQKETQQPGAFSYSNLGPKWTFGWLSYVTDDPAAQLPVTALYLPGGGSEAYSFDSVSQSFLPDPQSQALLVRTGPASYERRLPDGSKQIFNLSSGATVYPRKVFMTQMIDPAGNVLLIGYDNKRRVATITDALGRITTISYELLIDPQKITKVTDPFGRFATFQYENGKLKTITDEIGIQSQFTYQNGTDLIESLTTPYGTTAFTRGESGTNRWIEITDPMGGKERVEFRDGAPGIAASDPVAPSVPGIINAALDVANTFYWDKKAMTVAPGDYTKARIKHWLYDANGAVTGILSSEKQPLENRVWYTYAGQPDYQHVGSSANRSQVARVLADGTTQLSQYEYNARGNTTRFTDPAGRVTTYSYDSNQIDLLETRQAIGTTTELLQKFTYNSLHEPLTDTDAAGQLTNFSYNTNGQLETRTNSKGEITTYSYGGSAPPGHLSSITSPAVDGVSTVIRFGYDSFNRVRTVTSEPDQYTVTTDYDNLDRKTRVTFPDGTYEQFQYTDNGTGVMTLDLTASRDRNGQWTYRHYDGNRKMDSLTDPMHRTTRYGWCTCGSLTSITDSNGNVTGFNHDLQGRVYEKVFADGSAITYLFEGQTEPNTPGATSRLRSSTDALHRRTNYSYSIDNNISQITYTDSSGNPLDPATPSVAYTYDPNYDRVATMNDGTGLTTYEYHPINSPPGLGAGKLKSVDGPLADDTITFAYDELGRTVSQSVGGVEEKAAFDALGRMTSDDNALGHFTWQYDGVTARLSAVAFPNGQRTSYSYYGNDRDRRLQTLQNSIERGPNLSKFDYGYDSEGQVTSWARLLDATSSGFWFEYDAGQQLTGARNASNPKAASLRYDYDYDKAGNRTNDSKYDPRPIPGGGFTGTFTGCTVNILNQLDGRNTRVNSSSPVTSQLIYDLAGNLTGDGEGTSFEWDAANRLTAIRYPGNKRTEFAYDGLSRRVGLVEKAGSTVISATTFVWIGQQIAQERNESNVISRRYFAQGEQRRAVGKTNERYYYARDHLGSIREVTNSAGMVQAHYDYDPFGRRTKLGGSLDLDFGYTGHYHHDRSGLELTHYRAYHPALGRWLSRDPIEERGGLNLYGYVENNPVNATDPSGLVKVYGNWCGPDWTGSRREAYTPHSSDYYRAPINQLDSACEAHDICYYECRTSHPCNGEIRSQCFRSCDRVLTSAANAFGGFWGKTVALAIDRPGRRNPGPNESSCCQKGK